MADAGCNDGSALDPSKELSGSLSLRTWREELCPCPAWYSLSHLSVNGAEQGHRSYAEKRRGFDSSIITRLSEELRQAGPLGSSLALAVAKRSIRRKNQIRGRLNTWIPQSKTQPGLLFPLVLRANVGIALPSFFRRERQRSAIGITWPGRLVPREPNDPTGVMASVFLLWATTIREKKLAEAVAYWRKPCSSTRRRDRRPEVAGIIRR